MRRRTREIQHKRGLGPPADSYLDGAVGLDPYTYLPYDQQGGKNRHKALKVDEDDLDLKGFNLRVPVKVLVTLIIIIIIIIIFFLNF